MSSGARNRRPTLLPTIYCHQSAATFYTLPTSRSRRTTPASPPVNSASSTSPPWLKFTVSYFKIISKIVVAIRIPEYQLLIYYSSSATGSGERSSIGHNSRVGQAHLVVQGLGGTGLLRDTVQAEKHEPGPHGNIGYNNHVLSSQESQSLHRLRVRRYRRQ